MLTWNPSLRAGLAIIFTGGTLALCGCNPPATKVEVTPVNPAPEKRVDVDVGGGRGIQVDVDRPAGGKDVKVDIGGGRGIKVDVDK